MKRCVGTTIRGIRTPIIKKGDDLVEITVTSCWEASKHEGFTFNNKDVIGLTEGIVAKAQGNFASVDDISIDIKNKFPHGHIGIVFPILSRNRFALCLKGIARGAKKITMLLSYPNDEVGNPILDYKLLEKHNINPYSSVISDNDYQKYFNNYVHLFTGVNMVDIYREIVLKENCEIEFVFSNQPETILDYTKDILVCDIHSREITKDKLIKKGVKQIYSLTDILSKKVNNSGFNKEYGLLGSNRATDETIKLFPRDSQNLIEKIRKRMKELTGKDIEVMVYGDGAFKDPVGGIWELADPVVTPYYTKGLEGTPKEIKLKYIADNNYNHLKGEELTKAVLKEIKNKSKDEKTNLKSLGTTPRRIIDLLGSLCDLTSGSGDKGTPIILIQGYFDNYSDN